MKAQAKTAVAMLGGAAALALTIGYGGVGVSPAGTAWTVTTHPSTSVAPARPHANAPADQGAVHPATLTGCIPGANC